MLDNTVPNDSGADDVYQFEIDNQLMQQMDARMLDIEIDEEAIRTYRQSKHRPNRRKWGKNRITNHACGKRSEGNKGRLPKSHSTRVEAKAIIIKKRSNTHEAMAQDQLTAANAEFEDMMAQANDAMDWRADNGLYDEGQYLNDVFENDPLLQDFREDDHPSGDFEEDDHPYEPRIFLDYN